MNGHKLIDISGTDAFGLNAVTIQVAWVDCDQNKANAIIGVSKIISIDLLAESRLSALNNLSGRYVYGTVAATILPAKTLGIGPAIDLRSSPSSNIWRSLLVGLVSADILSLNNPIQIIVTPTKIM